MNKYQKRMDKVLDRLKKLNEEDEDFAYDFGDFLDNALESLAQNDYFGTECQNDPRGDGRDGEWSMSFVQGVDG